MWRNLTFLTIALTSNAIAQDSDEDSPWAEPDASESSESEASNETETASPAAEENTKVSDDTATMETETDSEPGEATPADSDVSDSAPKSPKPQKEPVVLGENFKPNGIRIAGYGTGSGVGFTLKSVMGSTGGTTAGIFSARYTSNKWGVTVGLPVAHYRTPGLRFDNSPNYATGLGNLAIDAHYVLQDGKTSSVIAVETHFSLGNRSYTWVNDGDELWPGYGFDVAWEGSSGDKLKKLYRLSLGLHGARGNSPFPSFFPRLSGVFGLDYSFAKRFGVTTEAALSYWDTSPFDIALMGRVDLLDGLRARMGIVMPVATWAGLIPANQEAGLTESTLFLDMRYAF